MCSWGKSHTSKEDDRSERVQKQSGMINSGENRGSPTEILTIAATSFAKFKRVTCD